MLPALISSHEAAIQFLYSRIDYERAGAIPYSGLKLERMRELLRRLGNPLLDLPVIHVAGTKGKGSAAAMISAALTAGGYRTGMFSSPHLHRVEERFSLDAQPADPGQLTELVERIQPEVEQMDRQAPGEIGPTFFEITTAMALLHFRRCRADLAVLEVGMGGRLDSTNVCRPLVSVITSISFDHTRQLGNTLSAIAGEKAGIIKPGVPVVSGVTAPEPREVIRERCHELSSPLLELERDFHFEYEPARHLNRDAARGQINFRSEHQRLTCTYPAVGIGSPGAHQAANAAIAIACLRELDSQGWPVPEAAIRRGLASVQCPARIEVMSRWPVVVRDAAHNVASIIALLTTLDESFDPARRILVFATTQDKDYAGMLERLLPAFDEVILTRYTNNPRGISIDDLDTVARRLGYTARLASTPAIAWDMACSLAHKSDLICITGSFYLAAEMSQFVEHEPRPGCVADARNIA